MAQVLFLLYWVLKSFYTSASGGLQIADFVFCASFAVFALQNARKLLKLDGPNELLKKDYLLLLFIAFVAFINLAYWLFFGDTGLLLAIAYFVFNRYDYCSILLDFARGFNRIYSNIPSKLVCID